MRVYIMSCLLVLFSVQLFAAEVFHDGFGSGPSSLWGNERGSWTVNEGGYYAQYPNNSPVTYTSLPLNIRNFTVEFDLNGISDGGVWLRSNWNGGSVSGVLLVTGGWQKSGTGFYWHVVHNDSYSSPLNECAGLFRQGDNVHIKINVSGDTYAVYLNGSSSPATTLTTSEFTSGNIGLYDYSSQIFDNLVLDITAPIVGLNNRACQDKIIDTASSMFLFTVWGKAYPLDQNSFTVSDGSNTPIKIIAPNYCGFDPGDIIRVTGAFMSATGQAVMTSTPASVIPLQ